MDPTANLAEQRRIMERFNSGEQDETDIFRFFELVEALDDWLSKGGFAPKQWQRRRR